MTHQVTHERRAFSVAVFAIHQGRILFIRHKRLGTWLPPGGELNEGETPLLAAARELREETGLEGRFTTLSGVTGTPPGWLGYEEHSAGNKGLHMNLSFVAQVDTDEIQANHEFDEFCWTSDPSELECPANVKELARLALATTRKEANLTQLAHEWLRCFNSRNLEGLLSLYSDDAVHFSPKLKLRAPQTGGFVRGKAALREWWSDAMQRLPTLHYELKDLTAGDGRVFIEYERSVNGEPPMMVAEVFKVGADGRICESKVYHG